MVLSTVSISVRHCFATVRWRTTLLCRAGNMLGVATHF